MIDKNSYIPFSRRNGITSLPEKETVKDFPNYILAAIRNQSYEFFKNVLHDLYMNHVEDFIAIKKHIWCYYFNRDLQELGRDRSGDIHFILEWLADALDNVRLRRDTRNEASLLCCLPSRVQHSEEIPVERVPRGALHFHLRARA